MDLTTRETITDVHINYVKKQKLCYNLIECHVENKNKK